jgi:hypothetical protein
VSCVRCGREKRRQIRLELAGVWDSTFSSAPVKLELLISF